ncbi:hypothetical protein V6C32_04940 [Desulforamulus ruminis]|uniref:SurA N-terminal domain-containing protein n=1 Tax=Desulforamulus ruminis (strain ATCC 23193 / DSM 2154 / NCIMB 8452 / DL) TaxID=696281 RepID=F6DNW8_DESRL|nr:hypothetical protein [Desulforamulus ruminis]AEG60687.1 hypothetical protein Desru_2448 [Desulforamulus ruminis DSM 2154]
MKKIIMLVGLCLVLSISSFIYNGVFASSNDKKTQNADEINKSGEILSQNAKKYKEDLKNEKVIALIGEEKILYKEFALKKIMLESKAEIKKTKKPTNKDVFEELKEDKISIVMAKQMDVYPTEAEVKEYISNMRKAINESDNPEALTYFTQNYGISEDEYWNEWSEPLYKQSLINIKLGNALASKVPQEKGDSREEYNKKVKENYVKIKDTFKEQIKVDILDNDLGIT